MIFANDRETIIAATTALDRVLLANHYIVPSYTLPQLPHRPLGPLRPPRNAARILDRLPDDLVVRRGEGGQDRRGELNGRHGSVAFSPCGRRCPKGG